jgi:hypothetical protein
MLFNKSRLQTDNKQLATLLSFDAIAQRYGWTFDYIESLPVSAIYGIKAIIEGEVRYRRYLEGKGK